MQTANQVTSSKKRKRTTDNTCEFEEDVSTRIKRRCTSARDPPRKQMSNAGPTTLNTAESAMESSGSIPKSGLETVSIIPRGPAIGFSNSILSRLPVELRLHIYEFVLAPKNPVSLLFRANEELQQLFVEEHDSHKNLILSRKNQAALLRTCRQIYTETADLLYQQRMFLLHGRSAFAAFAAMIGNQHLGRMRHIRLMIKRQHFHDLPVRLHEPHVPSRWNKLWSTIAGMRYLQTLRIEITFTVPAKMKLADDHHGRPILEPILALQGLRKFDLKYWVRWVWRTPPPRQGSGLAISLRLPSQTLSLIEEIKKAAIRPRGGIGGST